MSARLKIIAAMLMPAAAAYAQVTLLQVVESALERNPRLAVEREQVNITRAQTLQAGGLFDTQVNARLQQSRINTPLSGLTRLEVQNAGLGDSQSSNLTDGTAGVTRLLRSGIQVGSTLTLSRATDNLTQTHGVNLGQVRFQITAPLWRGKGRTVTEAEESASKIETGAALYDLNNLASTLIAEAASRYWQLTAARRNLETAVLAEERGQLLVNNVRTLIDADRMPKAELQQVLANLATRTANRAAAEQTLAESAQALAVAMGLPLAELRKVLDPTDPMPDGEKAALPSMNDTEVDAWIQRSLARRTDYLSLRTRQGAIEVRTSAARDRLRPQLDLKFSTGYSGLNEGRRPDRFVYSPFTNVGGIDAIGGIEYSLPIGRHTARGQIEALAATGRQNFSSAEDLARNIGSSVLAAVAGYRSAIIRVQQARKSVDASQAALDGEREKLRLGVGSVVDLLTLEDRLTSARSAYVDASLNYALLLTRLRQATGTFIEPDQTRHNVERSAFYMPPWEGVKP